MRSGWIVNPEPLSGGTLARCCPVVSRTYVRLCLDTVEQHDIERLRRSAVMAPPNSRFGTLTAGELEALCNLVLAGQEATRRYEEAIAQLRHVLDALEPPGPGGP